MEKTTGAENELMMAARFFIFRRIFIFIVQFFCLAPCFAQEYPLWFLKPAALKCGESEVGMENISYYPDSTAARATRNGYVQYAKHRATAVNGGQAFWSTEIGMFWMGSNYTEEFDSTAIASAENILTPLDTLVMEQFVAVLLGSADCELPDQLHRRVALQGLSPPSWIENLPESKKYFYARGLAPAYYYETSSWREAEKWAVRNLAREVFTSLQTVQKLGYEGQEILHEHLSVQLKNLQVAARWRDLNEKFFYVLIRMPKY
ncbi:MAG: LPP20 family lipoprotein [bacterium]